MCSEDRELPYPSDDIYDAMCTLRKLINSTEEYKYYEKQLTKLDYSHLAITLTILRKLE